MFHPKLIVHISCPRRLTNSYRVILINIWLRVNGSKQILICVMFDDFKNDHSITDNRMPHISTFFRDRDHDQQIQHRASIIKHGAYF